MKRIVVAMSALGLAGVLVPTVVSAQEITPEEAVSPDAIRAVETVEEEVEVDERLRWRFRVTSEVHSSDNAGFRELDETRGNQERLETDDRHMFGYTSVSLGANYQVLDDTQVSFGVSHSGLWGSDQLGGTNEFGGFFFVYDLHMDWMAVDTDAFKLNFKLGRQFYDIGGTHRDYFLRDNIDGLTANLDFGDLAGRLRILAFDLYASQGRPDTVSFLRWHAGRDLVHNMRGETNTLRYGAVYENTRLFEALELPGELEFRGFGYFAQIGGAGSGADRTHEGTLGNFSDQDFVWMAGTRIGYFHPVANGRVGAYGEYAYSGGIDRKEVNIGVNDVEIAGSAFGGAILSQFDFGRVGIDGIAQYFFAEGPTYRASGLKHNHGFVSFRGNYIGGLNMGRYSGWRPSAYVGRNGIHTNEHSLRRESGTQMIHAGLGLNFDPFRLDLGAWQYQDTGRTNLNRAELEVRGDALPSGYSRDELDAQQRLGRNLGLELNAALSFQANQALSIYGMGGIFMPGEFYEIEVSRNVGSARGSVDNLQNFWAISTGATLVF